MSKKLRSFLGCSLISLSVFSQPLKLVDEKCSAVSLGVQLPIGEFSSTHFLGVAAEYTSARQWYGKLQPGKQLLFSYNGGLAYYPGKKETVSSYDYKYPAYLFVHAFGGISYAPRLKRKLNINLTAGPALGFYNGNTQFNLGAKLDGYYFVSKRTSIGPNIILMKESGADAIWSLGFKVTRLFF